MGFVNRGFDGHQVGSVFAVGACPRAVPIGRANRQGQWDHKVAGQVTQRQSRHCATGFRFDLVQRWVIADVER